MRVQYGSKINGLLVDKVIDMIGKYKQKKAAEELNEEKVA